MYRPLPLPDRRLVCNAFANRIIILAFKAKRNVIARCNPLQDNLAVRQRTDTVWKASACYDFLSGSPGDLPKALKCSLKTSSSAQNRHLSDGVDDDSADSCKEKNDEGIIHSGSILSQTYFSALLRKTVSLSFRGKNMSFVNVAVVSKVSPRSSRNGQRREPPPR
jgi:hypothetical protein